MDRLTSMTVFVKAVDLGSFAAAAAALDLSGPMVGKHIRLLEERLGVRLINRTTRRQNLTEFGRAAEGQSGFLSNTKRQVARAKVEVRLVDVRTGHAYFPATGTGEAGVEQGTVMGFGSRADYDATLNDRAIGAAISDVLSSLVGKLEERPWRSDILKVEGQQVFISGGTRQGLKPGDRLAIMRSGDRMKSGQSGFEIDLPPSRIAEVVVDSTFGNSVTNEGSLTRIVSGVIPGGKTSGLFVAEVK